MKRLVPIGLLLLLLYHMFGLSFAVLCFEKDYEVAAVSGQEGNRKLIKMHHPNVPYASEVEFSTEIKGLIRTDNQFYNPVEVLHANDTLYITLESNQGARDRFAELAGAIEILTDAQSELPQSPYNQAIKLFGQLLKMYVPHADNSFEMICGTFIKTAVDYCESNPGIYQTSASRLTTPPPEKC